MTTTNLDKDIKEAIANAYELLFKKEERTAALFADFRKFCEEKLEKNETAVLYSGASSFAAFMSRHRVEIGRKEAIICDDGILKYTDDYSYRPCKVVKKGDVFFEVMQGWNGSEKLKPVKY